MIVDTLTTLTAGLEPAEAEIVVVANGCTDATAALAAGFADVAVVEIEIASKSVALNAGDRAVTTFPRLYVDADVSMTSESLRATIAALETEDAVVASPAPRFDLSHASWTVRAFYAAFTGLPYVRDNLVGLGVYGLSAAGRARFPDFPALTADDLFVQRLFDAHEVLVPGSGLPIGPSFTVSVPRNLASLLEVRTRVARGNSELTSAEDLLARPDADDAGDTPSPPRGAATTAGTVTALLHSAGRRPQTVLPAAVYVAVTLAARRRARKAERSGAAVTWERDSSSRTSSLPSSEPRADPSSPPVAYLVSQYPALSHAFIETEVRLLRERGVPVTTYSVREPDVDDLLTPESRADAAGTVVLQRSPLVPLVTALARVAGRSPTAMALAVRAALRSGPPGARNRLQQLFYLAEALILWRHLDRAGTRHLHVHFANNSADIARLVVVLGRAVDAAERGDHHDEARWTWSFSMHGPTEFEDVVASDLPAKAADAAWIACITDFCRSQLMRHLPLGGWDDLHLVRMGVDTSRYVPAVSASPDAEPTALRVLTVGRLVPEKGSPLLVDAVADLAGRGIAVQLDVVGAGPLGETLREQAGRLGVSAQVRLHGAVGQDRLPALYAACDVFALPSFAEGLPVVLMEAMASGVPVVTTPIAGIPELVIHGVNGLLVTPGRADALADALASLADDPDRRARMGRAAREAVVRRHDPRVAAERLSALFSGDPVLATPAHSSP